MDTRIYNTSRHIDPSQREFIKNFVFNIKLIKRKNKRSLNYFKDLILILKLCKLSIKIAKMILDLKTC